MLAHNEIHLRLDRRPHKNHIEVGDVVGKHNKVVFWLDGFRQFEINEETDENAHGYAQNVIDENVAKADQFFCLALFFPKIVSPHFCEMINSSHFKEVIN